MTDATKTGLAGAKQGLERFVGGAWAPAGFSWSLFEFARNPYYMLVVIYVFTPYFAENVAGGGVEGSALVAETIALAGIICALTAPLLGAMMDRGGRRKPVLFVLLGVIAVSAAALWWTTPEGGLGVPATMTLLVFTFCAYTYSEVMHNAMLPAAGRPDVLPNISGIGLALGNLGSVIGLMVVAVIVLVPALGFDPALHEPERFTGPYTAIWLAVFILPFFLFMPDGAVPGGTWKRASSDLLGLTKNGGFNPFERARRFGAYFMDLFRTSPDAMKFLISRMIYADGITAVMGLGGVYTATFLGWSGLETALFGIYGSLFAVLGGFLGGPLDHAFGAKRAIMVELTGIMIAMLLLLSITPDAIFYGLIPAQGEIWSGPVFTTLPDIAFLGCIAFLTTSITACIASSRYMLVSVAPKERVGEFFGFYAMVGSITVWIGPALYATFSRGFNDQRIGMASLMLLFIGGIIMLTTVKATGRVVKGKVAPPPVH
jgi:UMF1 family MFS transporter